MDDAQPIEQLEAEIDADIYKARLGRAEREVERLRKDLAEARRVKDDDNDAKSAYFTEAQELRAEIERLRAELQQTRAVVKHVFEHWEYGPHPSCCLPIYSAVKAALDAPPAPQDEAQ